MPLNRRLLTASSCALLLVGCAPRPRSADALSTATPIKHLVIIFGENISFDHYFGTYPKAQNPAGEPAFTAAAGTPSVNGFTDSLLQHNPNLTNRLNGKAASNPFRLDRTQASTGDQNHDYTAEQLAYNGGAADLFPRYTGEGMVGGPPAFMTPALVMGYYDGNTVTALWNYAQHFAMSDNSYGDQYGPSTPGAVNLISGQTNGVIIAKQSGNWYAIADGQGGKALTGDVDPAGDNCSDPFDQVSLQGRNIGDLLSESGVSWGWFEGGFNLTSKNPNGSTGCQRSTFSGVVDRGSLDYIPHHEPFQYYSSTANPDHTRPASLSVIGTDADGGAHHQYDLHDFFDAVRAGNIPAVSYLKASAFQDAHAGYSDPLDEQTFVVQVVNFLEQQPSWGTTAVIVLYDDSDGWYDHLMAPVGNASFDARADRLNGTGQCGVKGTTPQLPGIAGNGPVNGRCGPGPRQPFLVISPWARANYVDHTLTIQSSVLRFIEDNWLKGQRLGQGSFDASAGSIDGMFDFSGGGKTPVLFLDDTLGTPVTTPSGRLPN
jgi:phospholipase C